MAAKKTTDDESVSLGDEALKAELKALYCERDDLRTQVEQLQAELEAVKKSKPEQPEKLEYIDMYVLRTFGYRKLDLTNPSRILDRRIAKVGEVVAVTPAQAERGRKTKALGTKEDFDRQVNVGPVQISDQELLGKNTDAILSYLNQHSDDDTEIARVEHLELSRGTDGAGARDKVLDAIETIRAAKNG